MKSRRGFSLRALLVLAFAAKIVGDPIAARTAWAQIGSLAAAVAPAAPPPAPSGGGVGSGGVGGVNLAPPGSPAPSAATGTLGEGQATIVGGNVASARERAFTEAFKRAVDVALSVLVPEVRATQPRLVIQILGRARSFVRRYRTLEEGELIRGSYVVKIDADIDEAALRRACDRPPAPASTLPSGGVQPMTYLLVGAGSPEALEAVSKGLVAAGVSVRGGSAADAEVPARALAAAVRAQMVAVGFVSATAAAEGRVRGLGLEAVTCAVTLRVVLAGTGQPQSEESETGRNFAVDESLARRDCLVGAAAAVVARTVPSAPEARAPADLRTVVIDADVVEPAAILAMLKQLRALGTVSAVDVRRVIAGRAELRVRSRLPGAALVALLARDSVELEWLAVEATGDLVKARVRLSAAAGPPPAAAAGAATP